MSEQQSEPTTTTTIANDTTPSDAWGQPISPERQTELQGYLDRWESESNHGERKGPFDREPGASNRISLTGADVSWLAEQSGPDEHGNVPNLHVERANIVGAHLEGASLFGAHLEDAFLNAAWLDSKTELNNATLDRKTRLGDVQWGGVGAVNLTQIDWDQVPTLGDERGLFTRFSVSDYEAAVRAYRQVSAQLRAQGLSEVADRFSERAQIRQRKLLFRLMLKDWRRPWRLPGDLLRWLFSWFLALLAGYGYHPGRTLLWYLAVISGFAFAYFQATHGVLTLGLHPSQVPTLQWYEALVLSVSAFHGRGFFQPVQSLGDPVAILAAAEAVIGLFIEISFIATFTQRFFGTK